MNTNPQRATDMIRGWVHPGVALTIVVAVWAQTALGQTNTFPSSGNAGIGTTNPQQMLHLMSSGNAYIQVEDGSSNRAWMGIENGDGKLISTGNGIALRTDGGGWSDKLYVTNPGNVGIGTTSPVTRLDVNGAIWSNKGIDPWGWKNGPILGTYSDTGATSAPLYIPGAAQGLSVLNTSDGGFFGLISRGGNYNDYNTIIGWGDDADDDLEFRFNNSNKIIVKGNSGNVGIGTTNPQAKLDVAGDVTVSGNISAKYQDLAEWVSSTQSLSAATVVVLDREKDNGVIPSSSPYDTRVAGVVSDTPGIILGEAGAGKVKVATTGRVKVRVDATLGPIHRGDLLVSGTKPGTAMRSEPVSLGGIEMHRPGTLIGKALEPLAEGEAEILVLLSLQ